MRINCVLLYFTVVGLFSRHTIYSEPSTTLSDLISTEPNDPYSVVYALMARVLNSPELLSNFSLELIPIPKQHKTRIKRNKLDHFELDIFELDSDIDNGTIILRGSNILSLCTAFNYYLIHFCNTSYDWKTYSIDLPHILPLPSYRYYKRRVPVSYHENICTFGYTQSFWNWTVWERHIDWMAMQGINVPLALTGNEYIWTKTYMRAQFNLTVPDLQTYFAGPAFLPWQRMGNIRGWGGPLTADFMLYQYELQIQILARMNSFEMSPVLGGFSGHIPYAIQSKFPSANVTYVPNWHSFSKQYCCVMLLDFSDALFLQIASAFYEEQRKYYRINGTGPHLYSTDTYNEIDPPTNNSLYLQSASSQTYKAMASADSSAVWLLQGTFLLPHPKQEGTFWNNVTAKAYLSGVANEDMLILDLDSATRPQWLHYDSFYGKKWVWCALYNFGEQNGLFGNLRNISRGIPYALVHPNTSIYGVGTTMEGLENNYILYDLTHRMGWAQNNESNIDLSAYLSTYVYSRYGLPQSIVANNSNDSFVIESVMSAWSLLNRTLYELTGIRAPKSRMTANPLLFTNANSLNASNMVNTQRVWQYFVRTGFALANEPKFSNDLVDLTRQCLSDLFALNLVNFSKAFENNRNVTEMSEYKTQLLSIMSDTDLVLGTNQNWLFGQWIYDAINIGNKSKDDKSWLEFNARNVITLWGPNGEINNYASKQWNGIIRYYYIPQWNLFFAMINDAIQSNQAWNQTAFNERNLKEIEIPFQTNTSHPFQFEPENNTVDLACKLYIRYNLFGDTQCT